MLYNIVSLSAVQQHESAMRVCVLSHSRSCVQLFVTPWTVTHQAPLSMGFSRQEYGSGLPGDLPKPGIEPKALACMHISPPS